MQLMQNLRLRLKCFSPFYGQMTRRPASYDTRAPVETFTSPRVQSIISGTCPFVNYMFPQINQFHTATITTIPPQINRTYFVLSYDDSGLA